jgi:hypothetical protein
MRQVLASATEAETGAVFYGCQDAVPLRQTCIELGHPQPPTPIQVDNACAVGILNDTVKQRRSKAMDMRFYWVKDRIAQGQFRIFWRAGKENLADYFTKHHSAAHHIAMRATYLVNSLSSLDCSKGVFIGTNVPFAPHLRGILQTTRSQRPTADRRRRRTFGRAHRPSSRHS